MRRRFAGKALGTFLLSIMCGLLLTACSSIKERQARALKWWGDISHTVSGAVIGTKETVEGVVDAGKSTTEWVTGTVDDITDRIDKVEKGIESIRSGKELIEEGLKGTGDE